MLFDESRSVNAASGRHCEGSSGARAQLHPLEHRGSPTAVCVSSRRDVKTRLKHRRSSWDVPDKFETDLPIEEKNPVHSDGKIQAQKLMPA
jgi:hypothetical protein